MTDSITQTAPVLRILDPDFYVAPDTAIRWMHEQAPLVRLDLRPRYDAPVWVVSRWEDCRAVEGDGDTYVTRYGVHLTDALLTTDNHGGTSPSADPRFAVALKPVNNYDPVDHGRLRGLARDKFSPSHIRSLADATREVVRDCLEAIEPCATVDFMDVLANRVPLEVVCGLLGVSRDRSADFGRWAEAVFASFEPGASGDFSAATEMLDFFEGEIERRRNRPGDDLISALLAAELDGSRLTTDEILMWCWMTLVGGQETTANLLGGGLLTLLEHPDEFERLRADEALLPTAVEEMLRWVTPDRYMCRTAAADAELAGEQVRAGDVMFLWYTAANRDLAVFDDPFRFDVARRPSRPHLSFGFGPHFCIGAPLARLEGRIVFEELMRRFSRIELAGKPVLKPSTRVSVLEHLPLRFS